MLAGTKFSVDYLLPLKSEELLSQTQRQERAISHIHDDLKETTSAIIKELDDVERGLHATKKDESLAAAEAAPTPQPLRSSQPLAMPLISDLQEETSNSNDANTTRGPSVVFPSIENKPIVANSSFTYKHVKNKFGVEVKLYSKSSMYCTPSV